ncbi:Protein of unknown function [Seinonella peptonophila]|uniref:Anti-sigma-F factor Fin n=1 Tax=Seinonella peptonophila TaxID=112248 RepID=A0A1M4YM72_9BACL|nr:anti-sigma-F factor Fin [Seinonella peptonophila]SHF06925.1 Protein of unknown function [Seinonella peptonophila]
MEWEYVCRYCHAELGRIDANQASESQLGLDQLTPEERKDIITHNVSGKTQVRVVCETCQQTLENNPELLLAAYLFH